MSQNALIAELKRFWSDNKIGASGFDCTNARDCGKDHEGFIPAQEPLVGEHYGDGVPRLVVLALDPGSVREANDTDDCLKYREFDRRVNYRKWAPTSKRPHWKYTLETVRCILAPFRDEFKSIGPDKLVDVIPFFALANSVRCCQSKSRRGMADAPLYEKCRPFVRDELAILAPDILITQGARAARVIRPKEGDRISFPVKEYRKLTSPQGESYGYWIIEIAGKSSIWFHTIHPAARFDKRRFALQWNECITTQFPDVACAFWKERNCAQ